jgi:hypothetical protein
LSTNIFFSVLEKPKGNQRFRLEGQYVKLSYIEKDKTLHGGETQILYNRCQKKILHTDLNRKQNHYKTVSSDITISTNASLTRTSAEKFMEASFLY